MGNEKVQAKTSTVATEQKSDCFFPKSDSMGKYFKRIYHMHMHTNLVLLYQSLWGRLNSDTSNPGA